jgi:uncharacterized membrane protein YhaH (DUF805 family)
LAIKRQHDASYNGETILFQFVIAIVSMISVCMRIPCRFGYSSNESILSAFNQRGVCNGLHKCNLLQRKLATLQSKLEVIKTATIKKAPQIN